jgi:hypothetical protein
MDRRTILKGVGTAILGGISVTGAGAVTANKGKGYLPNDNVSHEIVGPFPKEQKVEVGNWIVHGVSWIAVPPFDEQDPDKTYKSTKDEILRYKNSVTAIPKIDGERIEDADQYWRGPLKVDGKWRAAWAFATPPKNPGEHSFHWAFRVTDDFQLDEDSFGEWEEGDIDDSFGTYTVVKSRGKKS